MPELTNEEFGRLVCSCGGGKAAEKVMSAYEKLLAASEAKAEAIQALGEELQQQRAEHEKEIRRLKENAIHLRDNYNILANRYNLAFDWAMSFAGNPLGKIRLVEPPSLAKEKAARG